MSMKIDFGPKFDWFDVLERLNQGAEPDQDQFVELELRAGQWPSCACGQLCKLLPKDSQHGEPRNKELRTLGVAFLEFIEARDWSGALTILIKIERASTRLLNEMGIPVVFIESTHQFRRKPIRKAQEVTIRPDIPTKYKIGRADAKPFAVTMGRCSS